MSKGEATTEFFDTPSHGRLPVYNDGLFVNLSTVEESLAERLVVDKDHIERSLLERGFGKQVLDRTGIFIFDDTVKTGVSADYLRGVAIAGVRIAKEIDPSEPYLPYAVLINLTKPNGKLFSEKKLSFAFWHELRHVHQFANGRTRDGLYNDESLVRRGDIVAKTGVPIVTALGATGYAGVLAQIPYQKLKHEFPSLGFFDGPFSQTFEHLADRPLILGGAAIGMAALAGASTMATIMRDEFAHNVLHTLDEDEIDANVYGWRNRKNPVITYKK